MEQVMKHYGNAILAVIVLMALGGILVLALSKGGFVDLAFQGALNGFFDSMKGLGGTT